MLCVAFFVVSSGIIFAAADFRPYSWRCSPRLPPRRCCRVHLHYLFGTVLIAHAGYAGCCWRDIRPPVLKQLGIAVVILAPLTAPILPNLFVLSASVKSLAYTPAPSAASLIGAYIPSVVTVGVFAGLVCASFVHPLTRWRFVAMDRQFLGLAATLYIVPPLALFLVSTFSSSHVFIARYYLPEIAGMALLGGCLVRIEPAGVRRIVALMVLIAGITAHGLSGGLWPQHEFDDWRGAIAATRALTNEDDRAVLLRSGFFEAANPEWLADPNYQGFLLAPLSAYPLDRPVIVLPYEVNPQTAPYLNKTLAPLTSRRRIVLIARFGGNIQTWLAAHFDTLGLAQTHHSRHGAVSVLVFERDLTAS